MIVDDLLIIDEQARDYSYLYVPRTADVQRTADGRPWITLLATVSGGVLMLTAEWRADASAVERARRKLADRLRICDARVIRFAFAPVAVTACRLLLRSPSGVSTTLAISSTSRIAPFSALFCVEMSAEDFAQVAAALDGQRDVLLIEYQAVLERRLEVRARLGSDSLQLIEQLSQRRMSGDRELRGALENAIRRGAARLVLDVPDDADAALVGDLYQAVLAEAVRLAPSWIDQHAAGGAVDLELSVTLLRNRSVPIRAGLDLAMVGARRSNEVLSN